ncbi:hypothetical protein AB0H83_16710 [Dactylosporangium sp. NPDC050688]
MAKPDGTGGCLWTWNVRAAALTRLGIAPPAHPDLGSPPPRR